LRWATIAQRCCRADPGFQEIAHGDWEGLLASEIGARDPVLLRAWRETPETVLMPGEGGRVAEHVLDPRAWAALERACRRARAGRLLLVVAHDAVQPRAAVPHPSGCPCPGCGPSRQAPTTLNLLEGPSPERLELVRLNDCSTTRQLFGRRCTRAL
jgi:probable phosphoglycerate mutase